MEEEQLGERGLIQIDESATKQRDGETLYYYYFEERIFLKERKDLLMVCFIDAHARQTFLSEMRSISSLKVWNPTHTNYCDQGNPFNSLVIQSVDAAIPANQIQALRDLPEVQYVSPMFGTDDNSISSVSNEFSVKLQKQSNYSKLLSLANQFGCQVIRHEGFDEGTFFVQLPKGSEYGVIELSAIFYETGQFVFTSPGFFEFGAMASVDPFFSSQWGLKNTGQYGFPGIDINIEPGWNITEGSSDVVVAVLDVGVELSHPDLVNNLVVGYDAIQPNNTPGGAAQETGAAHGTAVAGIICATRNDGVGISGVAPGCKLMPIRAGYYDSIQGYEGMYLPATAAGFDWARTHDADIINCSWEAIGTPCALLTSAIHNATTLGRNGKGCVVVFSSGNTNNGDNNAVSYPGSLYDVLAVGAISYNGKRKNLSTPDGESWSSNYGSTLDIVAPGVFISTTDRSGDAGYNSYLTPNDLTDKSYTKLFAGTSAAAPHASGIAALILSEYPDLPQEYVRRAIELGCIKHSAYTYVEDGEYPMDYRNDEVGHGLVRANLALGMAGQFNIQNTLDHTAGLDFTILNSSSYSLEDVIVDVRGTINNQTEWLISSDVYGGIESGYQVGYPVYRGLTLNATAGTPITDITFDMYASCIDCPGELEIGVAFDLPTPNAYDHFSFGVGETYETSLPNITVPNGTRRRVYVRIFDVN